MKDRKQKIQYQKSIVKTLALILFLNFSFAQNRDTSEVNTFRLGLVLGAGAGILTLAHLQQYSSWWKGELTKFHFKDDLNQVLQADKFGHAYFSYLISDLFGRALQWAGVEKNSALIWGGIGSLLFQTYVEIEDGFRPNLGFSTSDEIANFIGASFPYVREKIKALQVLNYKMSIFPSEKFKSGAHRFIVDDYESLYFWLSFDVAQILKSKFFKIWYLDFFDIAIGYSVKKIDWNGNGKRELFLAIDYDFTKIKTNLWLLRQIFHLLNYYHFPAPTLKIVPHLKFYPFKF